MAFGGGGGFFSWVAPVFSIISSLAGGGIGGGSAPEVASPGAPPSTSDEDIQAAGDAERKRRAKASGLKQTINTSGLGLLGEPDVKKPTLLGE